MAKRRKKRARRQADTFVKCETTSCEDAATCAGFCDPCYNWHWKRTSEGVAAQQRYRKKQRRINDRAETFFADKPAAQRRANNAGRSGETRAYAH